MFLIQYKKKLIISGDLFFCWNVLGTSDIQGYCSPKVITYIIYTLIHERDPVPCRITYIEYRSPVNIFIYFPGTPPNSVGVHCNILFFHSSTTPVVGGPLRWASEIHFSLYLIKRNWSFRGTCFLLKRSSWGISDIQGCCSQRELCI